MTHCLPASLLLFAAASLAAGCSLAADDAGFGKACTAGHCATGYVCDAANRCVLPVDPSDATAAGGALGASRLTGGTNTGAVGSSAPAGGASAGNTAAGGTGKPPKRPEPEADASPSVRDAGASTSADASGDATLDSGCSKAVEWYRDADGDGFGRSDVSASLCGPPPAGWAAKDGDCADDEPRAFPGQTSYFGMSYGLGSFDYDCSGTEEPDPASAGPAPDCPALALLVCTGTGFALTDRQRAGVDPTCGSTELVTCSGLLACVASTAVVPPKKCR